MTSLETGDPRKAIRDKEVKVRTAAARDLGRIGTWSDLPLLIEMATAPKGSAAVAVYAAAAATDIVHRIRLLGKLDRRKQNELLSWVSAIDPDDNPGLLMLMSAVRTPRALSRLGRMLRGQRSGVRAGAAKALRRRGAPLDALDDQALVEAVGGWLADPAMRRHADTLLELVDLVGECGWTSLRDQVRDAVDIERLHGEAVERALSRLDAQQDASAWQGLWVSDGRDVSEVGEPGEPTWLVIHDGQVHTSERSAALTVADGVHLDDERVAGRLGWFERLGAVEGSQPALQLLGRTWWRVTAEAMVGEVGLLAEQGGELPPTGWAVVAAQLCAEEGLGAQRLRALACWHAGQLDEAATLFDALIAQKKSKEELYYWRARVAVSAEQPGLARELLQRFLKKAPKRQPLRPVAEVLLSELAV